MALDMTTPTKTLAVRLFEYGGPEKLVIGEYDLPPLGDRDVLVKNHAGSVSRWDVKYRAGDLARYLIPGRAAFPLPQQLGREAAGEVIAVGPAVTRFKPGDRVIGVTHPEDPDSVETARGLGNLSRNLAIPGRQAFGSYAQYLVRDERMWLPLPDSIDFEQAGVALWPFSSSHRVVRDRLWVRPRRQRADHRRVRRHGPGDAATGEARRRPRDCHHAAPRQGRDFARAWR
jgi:NADPH:quinone reductase-like Zn-dependent oxidoreductase